MIRDADRRSIQEIAAARAELVGRARDGKLQLADLEDGTFTISNLGMFGIEQFIAVLNPPQAAILAVGATVEQPVVRDGQVVVRPLMSMTITCDHRAVDGADGAEFLRTVKELLEESPRWRVARSWYRRARSRLARAFYRDTLGFEEVFVDFDDGWSRLRHGEMEIALAEGEPDETGVSPTWTWPTSRRGRAAARGGCRGGRRLRAARADQARGRLRPGRQPHPARAVPRRLMGGELVLRRGGTQDIRFLRDMLHHAYYWREQIPARSSPVTCAAGDGRATRP